jgi:hypothetical protein
MTKNLTCTSHLFQVSQTQNDYVQFTEILGFVNAPQTLNKHFPKGHIIQMLSEMGTQLKDAIFYLT